ncbi:MAG: hypothetical protein Q9179_000149 [Wetmoreana sp. 5 TL-2023]
MSQEGARSLVKHDQRKEALSDVPRNQREVIKLPKFEAVVTNIIEVPKENINGNTRLELYFFPTISRNGAVRRQGGGDVLAGFISFDGLTIFNRDPLLVAGGRVLTFLIGKAGIVDGL